jgi:hypothetical protein
VSGFAAGDRVRIAASSHPWSGSKGVLVRPFPEAGPDWWKVRLERDDALDGHQAAAGEADLRHEQQAPAP